LVITVKFLWLPGLVRLAGKTADADADDDDDLL
jgi:hypothetical protein